MNELILVRHGETDQNRDFIVQGRIDNPLNDTGITQAKKTGAYLKAKNTNFDLVFSSPLIRAVDTAKLIAEVMDFSQSVIIDKNFIERNFGDFDGHKITSEYAAMIKEESIPNMEKHQDLERRVFEALKSVCQTYPDKRILIVTHSHVIKALLVRLVPEFTYTSYLANCSVNYLHYSQGDFSVLKYNVNPLNGGMADQEIRTQPFAKS
ncbi:MAG: histidine phosphatase family protein [Bacilli bacterium]|nr:histidine phosphatase family protein [Bacilli bacterium]